MGNMHTWSQYRYKKKYFNYFIRNSYITPDELEEGKEKLRKFWHAWAPLMVSTVALLLTALPSFLNLLSQKKEVVRIEYDTNIIDKIDAQQNKIEQLQTKIDRLTGILEKRKKEE
jgi:hypothetical protein